MAAVLAHQGGWDEILFVLAPIAVFGLLLWITSRRADREQIDDPDHPDPEP
jgi:cyanate permease